MKTLLILRHAKSSWKELGLTDHDRPLNKRGKRDAPQMGELIKQEGLVPDLMLSSTARRACNTAEIVAESSGYRREIQLATEFYHAPPSIYLNVLIGLSDEIKRVMVIGHNPGLEELLELLTGRYEAFPTAALAYVSLDIAAWHEVSEHTRGTLVNLWRPRELE